MPDHSPTSLEITQRVTLIGMLLDLLLGAAKIVVGIFSHSQALIADGIHSISDAVTDVFVLVITRISHSEPDADHPYGHGRFETLGTLILGVTLVGVAVALAYNNAMGLLAGEVSKIPEFPALIVALISIISKEWIYQYTRRAGEALRSNLLIANAWHSRSDALSSVVVLIGIAGAMAGMPWLDLVAAILVALIVAKIGFKLVWDSLKELVDTGLDQEQTAAIRNVILATEGVRNTHELRTRNMGASVYLDLHITVNPDISVSEGHQIGEWVTKQLLDQFDYMADVTYHIDPEDDHKHPAHASSTLLPLRKEVMAQLKVRWGGILQPAVLASANLHYLDSKINVEVFIEEDPLSGAHLSPAQLEAQLNSLAQDIEWFDHAKVWVGAEQMTNGTPQRPPQG